MRLQRPGGNPRARNSSASHAGRPGARASRGFKSDGALAIRQRMRAPLKLGVPARRTSQQGTPERSDATARRRVAVKSSTLGSPQISPITAESAAHLTPSSIAHSASLASRASTWTRSDIASPGGWTRPLSRMAIRSWTQSRGLSAAIFAKRKPAQPPSRGCAANNSERVGLGGAGMRQGSPSSRERGSSSAGPERAETAPPATRDKPFATRLTTLMFYFCSLSRESERRVNPATRKVVGPFEMSAGPDWCGKHHHSTMTPLHCP